MLSKAFNPVANFYAEALLQPPEVWGINFLAPSEEGGFFDKDSVTREIYKNPLVLGIAGTRAVLMQLMDDQVGTGVWRHSDFKNDASGRQLRTLWTGMATIYAPKDQATFLINHASKLHGQVKGETTSGKEYSATDPEALQLVDATVAQSMIAIHQEYLRPLSAERRDQFYDEKKEAHEAFGGKLHIKSESEMNDFLNELTSNILNQSDATKAERNARIHEFIDIMKSTPIQRKDATLSQNAALGAAYPLQRMMLWAAIDSLPEDLKEDADLNKEEFQLEEWERGILKFVGKMADEMELESHPATQAALRDSGQTTHMYEATQPPDGTTGATNVTSAQNLAHSF